MKFFDSKRYNADLAARARRNAEANRRRDEKHLEGFTPETEKMITSLYAMAMDAKRKRNMRLLAFAVAVMAAVGLGAAGAIAMANSHHIKEQVAKEAKADAAKTRQGVKDDNSMKSLLAKKKLKNDSAITFVSVPKEKIEKRLVDLDLMASDRVSQPVGIASVGLMEDAHLKYAQRFLFNSSVADIQFPMVYKINTDSVTGKATIHFVEAASSSEDSSGTVKDSYFDSGGSSLQLNVMMKLTYESGQTYIYWLQNVAIFSGSEYVFHVDISNQSIANHAPLNNTLNGTGSLFTLNGQAYYLYGDSLINNAGKTTHTTTTFQNGTWSYTEKEIHNDINVTPIITLAKENGTVEAKFGSYDNPNDKSTISYYHVVQFKGTANAIARIVVDPTLAPNVDAGLNIEPLDAEFVWGGDFNGHTAYFTNMDAKMSMFFDDNGTLQPFPTLLPIGFDTAEGAQNLAVEQNDQSNNSVTLTTGPLNIEDVFALKRGSEK